MINRINECKILKEFILQENTSRFIFLVSRPGIGKSCVINETISQIPNTSFNYIEIKINSNTPYSEGGFLIKLAISINDYAIKTSNIITLSNFLKEKNKKISSLSYLIQSIASDALPIDNTVQAISDLFNETEKLQQSILDIGNVKILAVIEEYLSFVLEKNPFILKFDNFNMIDDRTLFFLKTIALRCENLCTICEYNSENGEARLANLYHDLKPILTQIIYIERLPEKEILEALKIAHNKEYTAIQEIIESSYIESDGNLYHLEMLFNINASKRINLKNIKYDNTIYEIYSSLKENEKMLLAYIFAHEGIILIDTLCKLYASQGEFYSQLLFQGIDNLVEIGFLEKQDNSISVKHDMMRKNLISYGISKKYYLLANRNLLQFYEKQTNINVPNNICLDTILKQIRYILNIGGEIYHSKINYLLEILSLNINSTNCDPISKKLLNIFDDVLFSSAEITNNTYERIVSILYKVGYIDEIIELNNKYTTNNPSTKLILLLTSSKILSQRDEVIDDIGLMKKSSNSDLSQWAIILEILYYRVFNNMRNARKLWRELYYDSKKRPETLTAVIHEFAALVYPKHSFVYEHLDKSIQLFKNSNIEFQLISSILNKSAAAFRNNNFKLANECIIQANGYYNDNFPLHILLNQQGICSYKTESSNIEDIVTDLRIAYQDCGTYANKIVIISNMIYILLKNKNEKIELSYVEELEKMLTECARKKTEYFKYGAVNIYKYYKLKGLGKEKSNISSLYSEWLLNNEKIRYLLNTLKITDLSLLLQRQSLSNLVNWKIDFDNVLKH